MKLRRVEDGATGELVERGDKEYVHLDRDPLGEELVGYLSQQWVEVSERRPLSPAHRAQVAFEADRAYLHSQGDARARREWHGLPEDVRRDWIEKGPRDPVRRKLYEAVMGVMAGLG